MRDFAIRIGVIMVAITAAAVLSILFLGIAHALLGSNGHETKAMGAKFSSGVVLPRGHA